MPRYSKQSKQELESRVYDSVDDLIKACALRWTIENLGQQWPDVNSMGVLMEMHMDGVSEGATNEGEMEDSLHEEFDHWKEDASKHVKVVVERDLPLTMANVELSFSRKL